jgi:hypothetical protein
VPEVLKRSPITGCGRILGRGQVEGLLVVLYVLNGECSFLIPHLKMGCREETWVMVNTFKVDEARGTV